MHAVIDEEMAKFTDINPIVTSVSLGVAILFGLTFSRIIGNSVVD